MNNELLRMYFGEIFLDKEERNKSYVFIEDFISENVKSWDLSPNTDELTLEFSKRLKEFSIDKLIFLICHSGYIPEFYAHDSSQETLYSKLVESLVCEWSVRIGFVDSSLQKQKSSKEDITIKIGDDVVVCDAKSFRLGRSQSAPNVKDTIKKADYEKWLESYPKKNRLGGLLTFPYLHLWSKSSDVFSYVSDGSTPIVLLVYEQMSYILYKSIGHKVIIDLMFNYSTVHPTSSKSPSDYFSNTLGYLFDDIDDWNSFNDVCNEITIERVQHTIKRIEDYLTEIKIEIRTHIESIPIEELKQNLIESQFHNICGQLEKQLFNIRKFRPH